MALCPFTIAVDSREQTPWHFTGIEADEADGGGMLIVPLATSVTLKTGDYSIVGCESQITCERKGVSDWFGSITKDRERFEREMVRMAEMEFAAVVIEGDWAELLLNTARYSRISPKACARTILSWSVRYGVHFFPTMNRRHAELTTFQLLNQFWKQKQEALGLPVKPTKAKMDHVITYVDDDGSVLDVDDEFEPTFGS